MRDIFPEYYQPTKKEFEKLWHEAFFVLDTNILLNFYRYSKATREDFFKLFERKEISKRIWIPHQVALEFARNRKTVILSQQKSVARIVKAITEAKKSLYSEISKLLDNRDDHSLIDIRTLKKKLDGFYDGLKTDLDEIDNSKADLLVNDPILDRIEKLIKGKIGLSYERERLKEIEKDGQERYKAKQPPGYKDEKNQKSRTESLWRFDRLVSNL